MKFLIFNNLISEKYITKDVEALSIDEAINKLNLNGNFLFIIGDKKYRYPEDKDFLIPQINNIIIKRIPKNSFIQIGLGATIAAFAGWTGIGATLGYTLITSGIAALITPKTDFGSSTGKNNYSLSGGDNSIAKIGDKYPCVFGKHLITPPLVGTYFTSLSSNTGKGSQYITGMVCLGYNELSLSKLQFGNSILSNNTADVRNGNLVIDSNVFTGTVEVRQDGTLPVIYNTKMYEEQPNILIDERTTSGNFDYIFTSPKNTTTIRVFFSFAGLYYMNDEGKVRTGGAKYNLSFRKKGSTTWTKAVSKEYENSTKDALRYYMEYTFTPAQLAANPSGEWEVAFWRESAWRVPAFYQGLPTLVIKRINVADDDPKGVNKAKLDVFQCEVDDVPVIDSELSKLCLVAFKIKATEKNTGSLGSFNCVAQRLQPAWDGITSGASGWSSYTANSNPASAFLLALQGDMLPTPVADSRIDWTALENLYTWCNTNYYRCDGVLSESQTAREVLDKILFTCRAYFYMKNGVYSFIHDNYQDSPLCILSPENSSNFKATKSFEEKCVAYEITYNNANDSYESTSEQVYPHGETPAIGDLIDKQTFWGITSHDQVYKIARYNLAATKLRPESYEVKVGVEHFGLPLGSRVLLQHDVLSVGLDSGIIKSIDSGSQITLNKKVYFDQLTSQSLVIFLNDGSIITKLCDFSGESTTVGYTDKVILNNTGLLNAEDIFAFGFSGSETIDCMVKSKSFESSPDLSATLTLIGYNEDIYSAATQAIPEYESKISNIPQYEIKTIGTNTTDLYSDNNGNSVQDDGAIYFTFEDSSINGTTLVNMGSFKDVSDSIPTNLVRSTDAEGNVWADSVGTSLIPFKIDNIFYKNFSINFFVKDLDLTTDGYLFKYEDITYSNLVSLSVESGDLIFRLQLTENIIPITISGSGNNSMLSFSVDFDNNFLYVYENNNLILTESIGIANLVDNDGNNIVDNDGNNVIIYLSTNPTNTDRDVYFNLLSTDATDGFSGSIRRFRIFGFALESSDVDSLYNNEYLLQNILAAGRYLGELISAPTIVNQYDTFTYSGSTNVDFVNGKEYTWNGYKWIIWNL